MRIIHRKYGIEIPLQENQIQVLQIENPRAFVDIAGDLWRQVHGETGEIILSENEKEEKLSKNLECIFNPFALECNDKKILSRIYQEIQEEAKDSLIQETVDFNERLLLYLDRLVQQSPYGLEYDFDMDTVGLLKLCNVRLNVMNTTFEERVVEYFRVMKQVCKIRVFVGIHLKAYMSVQQLQQLYEFCFYEKIHLVLLESSESEDCFGEKRWILDKDLCIIEA